ncbi:MAG: AAA family ATPase, partial [Elusimicrobiota bacterium]|nr:AAA family ATPase [Elusimicrobiota bacterium]
MINREALKEIILDNRSFIEREIISSVERDDIKLPRSLNKVVIFYGVRRSGKTFLLYDLFRKHIDSSLYIDFEDERLKDFRSEDFEIMKEVFLELFPELLNKKKYFFLDEVQNIAQWEKFCRRAVERENIAVFAAGSSSQV